MAFEAQQRYLFTCFPTLNPQRMTTFGAISPAHKALKKRGKDCLMTRTIAIRGIDVSKGHLLDLASYR